MKIFNNITDKFRQWLMEGILSMEELDYLCINLYEDEDEDEYNCELVGTDNFLKDENDWNFDELEVFSRENPFKLCKKEENDDNKLILLGFSELIADCLKDQTLKSKLKNKTLAYGFVDGALYFVDTNN